MKDLDGWLNGTEDSSHNNTSSHTPNTQVEDDAIPPANNPPGIVEYKFLVMMTLYPNGKLYHKMIPLSVDSKASKKPKKAKKKIKEVKIEDAESY